MFNSYLDSYYSFIINFDIITKKKNYKKINMLFHLIFNSNLNFSSTIYLNDLFFFCFSINFFYLFSKYFFFIKPFLFENLLFYFKNKKKINFFNFNLILNSLLNLIENSNFYFLKILKNKTLIIKLGE